MKEPFINAEQKETFDLKKILRMYHPDTNSSSIPTELVGVSEEIIKMVNEARRIGSESWRGTFSDSDPIRLFRENNGVYEQAEREMLIGSPREFLANLQRYINTGKLPSLEWEQEVKTRKKFVPPGQAGGEEEDMDRAQWEAMAKKEEELRAKYEKVRVEIEKKFPFVSIELPDPSFDSAKVLFCLQEQVLKNLQKLPVDLQKEIYGTKISFIEGLRLFATPIMRPVELYIEVPGYYKPLKEYEEINRAAEGLHQIRERNKDKVENPLSLPTDKTFFWIQDLSSTLESKYGFEVEMGKYDDKFAASKISNLQDFLNALDTMDEKYRTALRGSKITFEGEHWNYSDLARMKIVYPWYGVSDDSAYGMVQRVKSVVDGEK